jgi:hypothetical protein
VDDVRAAQARGDREHVRTLVHVLHHFLKAHPEALPPQWRRAAPGGDPCQDGRSTGAPTRKRPTLFQRTSMGEVI